jgi:hypothetical protein
VDVHSGVVEQSSSEPRVVVVVFDATVLFSSSVAYVGVHNFSVDLVSSAYAREESPVQHFLAHSGMQSSPQSL